MKPNGYILHEDSDRVVIATGFSRASENPKTGAMIQVYILARAQNPLDAVRSGLDELICGQCPLRGKFVDGKFVQRACYVNLGQGPRSVYAAYQAGSYPMLASDQYQLFDGLSVRFGTYGDPVYIPLDIVTAIAARARTWTGYSHQWRESWAQGYAPFLMASTEDKMGTAVALASGWRAFRVAPVDGLTVEQDEVICPNTTHGTQCIDCGLCAGAGKPAKSIVIEAHGSGQKHVRVAA